jgi:hypothetical protein
MFANSTLWYNRSPTHITVPRRTHVQPATREPTQDCLHEAHTQCMLPSLSAVVGMLLAYRGTLSMLCAANMHLQWILPHTPG